MHVYVYMFFVVHIWSQYQKLYKQGYIIHDIGYSLIFINFLISFHFFVIVSSYHLVWRARPSSLLAHAKEEGSSKGHT